MPEVLTREKAAAHVATSGARCPFCGSGDLEPQGYGSRDYGVLDWKIYCNACEETYTELYALVGLDTEDDAGSVDVSDVVVAMLRHEPIFISLEGGIVQGVGLPKGLSDYLDVVVTDWDSRDFEPCELTEYVHISDDGRAAPETAHLYSPQIWEHTDGGVDIRDPDKRSDAGLAYRAWLSQQFEAIVESADALDAAADALVGPGSHQTGLPDLEESLEDSE